MGAFVDKNARLSVVGFIKGGSLVHRIRPTDVWYRSACLKLAR
jgi:hypothetical protein